MALRIVPCELATANSFIAQFHRHHDPVAGHRFALAVANADRVVCGLVIVGRPITPRLRDGWTVEVNRLYTDNASEAYLALHEAAWVAALALGYRRLFAYAVANEPAAALRRAGWEPYGSRARWHRQIASTGNVTWPEPEPEFVQTSFENF